MLSSNGCELEIELLVQTKMTGVFPPCVFFGWLKCNFLEDMSQRSMMVEWHANIRIFEN